MSKSLFAATSPLSAVTQVEIGLVKGLLNACLTGSITGDSPIVNAGMDIATEAVRTAAGPSATKLGL